MGKVSESVCPDCGSHVQKLLGNNDVVYACGKRIGRSDYAKECPSLKLAKSVDKALASDPLPPENESDEYSVDVLPAILVNVYVHPDFVDEDTPKVDWPQFVAVPPMIGDEIVALDQHTIGEVINRQHSMDGRVGPLLSLIVKIREGE